MSASSSLSSLSAQPAAIGSFHDDNSYSYNHIDCSGTKTTIPGLPRHPPLLTLIRAKPQKYSMLERKHGAKPEKLLILREINEILNTPINSNEACADLVLAILSEESRGSCPGL